MSYEIKQHRLTGRDVEYLETKNKDSGSYGVDLPDTIVIHFTAGSSLESAVDTLQDPNVKASAHLVVGRNGDIKQLIPFDKIAWHAGQSEWEDRIGLNKYSIGIEIDNAGRLSKNGNHYLTWWGGQIPENQVFEGIHRNESVISYWHSYEEVQIFKVWNICQALKEKYSMKTIVGHEEIAPERKVDPGPAFPLDKLRSKILEDRSDDSGVLAERLIPSPELEQGVPGIVTASKLNFRLAPSTNSELKSEPLMRNTRLTILDEKNGWYYVKVDQLGWVKKDYIKKLP